VDSLSYAFIIVDYLGSDLAKVEEVLLSNLLFHPRTRTEEGRIFEFFSAWLLTAPQRRGLLKKRA
jgi:hypothetical protein